MSATARSYSVTSYGTPLASHASLGLASSHSIGFFAPSTVGLDRSISRITSGNSEGATIPTSRMLKHDVTGPQEHFNTTTFTFRPSRSSNGSFTQLGHYPVANITRSTLSYDGYNSTTFSYLPSGHVPSHNNGTNSTAKLCWAEWASYWSHPTNTTSTEFQYLSSQTVIDVTTATAVQAGFAGATFTYSSGVNTQTITDNGWTILDVETLAAATTIILPAEPTKTVYETWTITSLARVTTAGVSTHVATITAAPSPSCRLPHRVPQCQSEWDSWISIVLLQAPSVKNRCNTIPVTQPRSYQSCLDNLADDPAQALALSVWARKMAATGVPHCPQASMPADVCTALVDGYASGQNLGFVELTSSAYGPKDIQQLGRPIITSFSNGYLQSNDSGAWAWPTHSTLAPGCTVGCGRCTVAGDHVKLLYWPPTPTNMTRAPNAAPLTAVFQNVTQV